MSQRIFGLGNLFLIAPGAPAIRVGILQDVSFEFKASQKDLIGQYQVAVDSARAEVKVSGKVKYAEFNGKLIGAMLAGSTSATGTQVGVGNEEATIPASVAYTVTCAHAATWLSDLGVYDVTSNSYLTATGATAPGDGEYHVAAGIYTFNSAQKSHVVQLAYDYTVAATGTTISYKNQLMGTTTFFAMKLYNNFTDASGNANMGLYLPRVHFPDLSFAMKKDDWTMSDASYSAIADDSGLVVKTFLAN